MNRKQWFIGSAILAVIIILGVLVWGRIIAGRSNVSMEDEQDRTITELTYCNSSDTKPCVVSFGFDADGNMLVNLLLSDLSFPHFYLEIKRDEGDASYKCQRIASAPNNANCIGYNFPPGAALHMMLFSTTDDALLAEGDLPIISPNFLEKCDCSLKPTW